MSKMKNTIKYLSFTAAIIFFFYLGYHLGNSSKKGQIDMLLKVINGRNDDSKQPIKHEQIFYFGKAEYWTGEVGTSTVKEFDRNIEGVFLFQHNLLIYHETYREESYGWSVFKLEFLEKDGDVERYRSNRIFNGSPVEIELSRYKQPYTEYKSQLSYLKVCSPSGFGCHVYKPTPIHIR